jgi:hypothetical protein
MAQWTDTNTNITWNYTLSGTSPDQVARIGTGSSATYGNATTTGTGLNGVITIPDTVDGYTVTAISQYAFKSCSGLTSITIPDSVTTIGIQAFTNCTSLTSITIPDSVTYIDTGTFDECAGLTSVTIGNSVTSIGIQAFGRCTGLTSINIPDLVTTIGINAFWNCTGLTSINIPDLVTTIGTSAFESTSASLVITMNTGKFGKIVPSTNQTFFGNTSVDFDLPPEPPSMTITSTTTGVTSGSTTNNPSIALTFTSSEATIDFVVGDITVTNGALSAFDGSGTVYTATFTPTGQGVCTIDISAGVYTDAATNLNNLATQFNWTFDLAAGGLSIADLLAAGFTQTQIDIAFTQIKIHSDFTISDGTSSSVFVAEIISPNNPLNTPNVFASTDVKTTTPQKWQDIEISSTGQYQIAVVGGYSLSTGHSLSAVTGNVWISTDSGETWLEKTGIDQVSGAEQSWMNACVSADGSVMMVKAMENIVYRSENGGVSWTQKTITNFTERVSSGWDGRPYYNLLMASDGQRVIIGTYNNVQTKMMISTDGGTNWADLTSLSSGYEYIIDYHMSKSGKYILVMFNNSTRPKYSDDFGATFITITDTNLSLTTETSTNMYLYSRGICAISDNGYAIFTDNINLISTINLTTGTVSNNAYDGTWVAHTSSGFPWAVCISKNGKYMIVHLRQNGTYVNTMYISSDYGTTFTVADINEFYVGYKQVTFNSINLNSRCFATRFSDDNKYIAAIQEGDHIYVRKNTFIQNTYTLPTFAAKLTADLSGNNVTVDGDSTTTDSTPYYRLYLQFANAVTLTGMPKSIFNIPFSDFSVGAGGQVNLRNVNLDASMNIVASYSTPIPFGFDTVFVTDTIKPLSTAFNGTADSYGILGPTFSNIVNDGTKFFDRYKTATLNADGSTIAMSYGASGVKVFDRDPTEVDGWKKIGNTFPALNNSAQFGYYMNLSNDGQIIAITDDRNGTISTAGYTTVYRRNAAEATGWELMGGAMELQGIAGDYQRDPSLSGDGTIIAVGTNSHSPGKVRVFNYDDGTNTWVQQGATFTPADGKSHPPSLSSNGTVLAIPNATGTTGAAIYERTTTASTTWTQIGSNIAVGRDKLILNKNGDIFAYTDNTTIYVYKRDTNDASGWSLMGDAITMYSIGTRIDFDDVGHTVTCSHHSYGGNVKGIIMIYKYNTASLVWEHAVTDNAINTYNTYSAGGTDPIVGVHHNQQFNVHGHALSGDGSKLITTSDGYNGTGSECYIYTIPHIKVTSNTSTIQAGNNFINNFVSTIETDLVDYTLSYDASNALIEFVGLGQDISMNITSNDTTVFDTSITEITTTANTLPFITYGQPDPTLTNYIDNGITTNEFVSNGYTIQQLFAAGVIPDWALDTDANHFDQSYVKGFTDVSGSVVIRNDNKLITNGDLSLGGNLTVNSPGTTSFSNESMTLKSHLFMGEDISANGNVYIGGDLSVNGQFSGNFANNIIPSSAIAGAGAGGIDISGNVLFTGDVSFNGPTVDVNIPHPPLRISDSILSDEYTLNSITYKLIPLSSPVAITDVYITSLDDIEPHSALITGSHVSNTFKCVFYKYETDDTDAAVTNNWICGHYESALNITRVCRIEFTLNGSISSIQQISRAFNSNYATPDTGSALGNGDYTSSALDLAKLFNDLTVGSGPLTGDLNYALTDFYYKRNTIPPYFESWQIPYNDLVSNGGNYILPAASAIVLSNVSINSLDEIEPADGLLMAGAAINNGGAGASCVFYKYPVDASGNELVGNWIFAYRDGDYTKSVRIAFTLNGTTPYIQQIGVKHDGGTGTDYTASDAALIGLYNDGVGYYSPNSNSYSLDRFAYKILSNNIVIPESIGVSVVGPVTNVPGLTYKVIPYGTAAVIPNVTVYSLSQIELVSAYMAGNSVTNGVNPCAIYKYQDANGSIVPNNWVCGITDDSFTKAVRLEFTLNGTALSVIQVSMSYNGTNTTGSALGTHDYTSTAADLSRLFNDTTFDSNVSYDNTYAITNASIKVSNPPIQANLIEFSDGTMTTHDDNILSGTFAGADVIFKDSTFAQVICEGVANADSTTETSDYRIKDNVTELNETDTVDALVPIQYNNTKSGNHEFGLLAHELQEVYPDLVVGEKDGAEYQRVHYNGLIGVLVKEIQGLKQRLAVLNNR